VSNHKIGQQLLKVSPQIRMTFIQVGMRKKTDFQTIHHLIGWTLQCFSVKEGCLLKIQMLHNWMTKKLIGQNNI